MLLYQAERLSEISMLIKVVKGKVTQYSIDHGKGFKRTTSEDANYWLNKGSEQVSFTYDKVKNITTQVYKTK